MTKVIRINENPQNAKEFIDLIQDKNILVYEDVQGSRIFVKYTGDQFIIKPKSLRGEELNFIDLTVQKFYNDAYYFFQNLSEHVKNLLNPDWWFVFEYFPDSQPANIEYNRKPKNNLILTCIVKTSKYIYNIVELVEYARLFGVDHLPIIFNGKLNSKQLEIINLFLNTSEKDLIYIFDQNNFAKFFYDILNPYEGSSFLMEPDNFNDNLEKIVIKIDGEDEFSFEILNPLYQKISDKNNTEYLEIYSIVVVNFLQYCQLINFKTIKLKGLTKDELYIDFICKLFNEYINDIKNDVIKWKFDIPQFFKEDKFKINVDLIQNKKTVETLKIDPKIEYIFKIILGSFNKKKKKPVGVFDDQTVILFNAMVDKINQFIDSQLKINRELKFQKSDLLNFNDFVGLNFNTDGDGKLYPDVLDTIEDGGEEKKKKKKGFVSQQDISKLKKENYQSLEDDEYLVDSIKLSIPTYFLANKISEKLSLGNIIKKTQNNFVTNQNICIILSGDQEKTSRYNFLLESNENIIDIYQIQSDCIKNDKSLYLIISKDFISLNESVISETKAIEKILEI